jgi:hypothetical protein
MNFRADQLRTITKESNMIPTKSRFPVG